VVLKFCPLIAMIISISQHTTCNLSVFELFTVVKYKSNQAEKWILGVAILISYFIEPDRENMLTSQNFSKSKKKTLGSGPKKKKKKKK
jgi:hypothetical protein